MGFLDPIVAGAQLIRDAIQSANFDSGVTGSQTGFTGVGWQIKKDGTASFGTGITTGNVYTTTMTANKIVAVNFLYLNGVSVADVLFNVKALCQCYTASGGINALNTTWTDIPLDTPSIDNRPQKADGTQDLSQIINGNFVCRKTGWYRLFSSIGWYPDNRGVGRYTRMLKNNVYVEGSAFNTIPNANYNVQAISQPPIVYLVYGDIVKVQAFQDSGAIISTRPRAVASQNGNLDQIGIFNAEWIA